MKIICTQENLLKGLNIVSSCIKKSTSLSILSNILLVAEKGQIKANATNLEIGIITVIRGKIEKEGRAVIPAQLFLSYINNLPSSKITMELKEDKLSLSSGEFNAEIKCFDPNEFPLIPQIKGDPVCSFSGKDFKGAVSQTIFSAAKDESRPEIAGVLFKLEKSASSNMAYFVATDSYRLAEKKLETNITGKTSKELIVPHTTFQEVNRVVTPEDKIDVYYSDDQLKFIFNGTEMVSKLVEGQYPDYKQIIPENYSTKIKLDRKELITALKSSSLFSKPDTSEINIEVYPEQKELKIVAESRQVGNSITKISNVEAEGREEKVVFNYNYVLEGLSCMSSPDVTLKLNGDSGPSLLEPTNDKNYLYIIMPIKK